MGRRTASALKSQLEYTGIFDGLGALQSFQSRRSRLYSSQTQCSIPSFFFFPGFLGIQLSYRQIILATRKRLKIVRMVVLVVVIIH